jgi:hypothetical protein
MTINITVSHLSRLQRRSIIAVSLPFLLVAQTAMVVPALFRAYGSLIASAIQKWNQ